MRNVPGGVVVGLAAIAALPVQAQEAAPATLDTILVTVNGARVEFPRQGPIRSPGGTVLVPLRGVFEKLGATVRFDEVTKTVFATRGATSVTLQLGESVGYVNGVARSLNVPAQSLGGVALVPLRFLSEAFGAEVKWDGVNRIVAIAAVVAPPRSAVVGEPPTEPPPAPPRRDGALAGSLVAIAADQKGLTLKSTAGTEESVPLSPEVVVLVKAGESPATKMELTDLRPGDAVRVRRGVDGAVLLIEARYEERTAVVRTVDPLATGNGFFVAFTEGLAVEVAADAPVMREDGTVTPDQLRLGDRVKVRINPETMRAIAITVVGREMPAPAKAEIEKVTHDLAGRWIRAGETVVFTVVGTPGAKGEVKVPGVTGAESLPLTESDTAGTYTASLTVPAGVFVKEATAQATLTLGMSTSPLVASAQTFGIDSVGPTLGTVAPPDNARLLELRPQLSGMYADSGSGIDGSKCQLILNGQEITADAVFTDAFFSYKPAADLKPGPMSLVLIVRDRAGNETQRTWSITLASPELIRKVSVVPDGRPVDFGDVVTVQVEGVPGATATFSLGAAVKNQPMKEDSPGIYIGSYTIQATDLLLGGNVLVNFTPPGGKTITRAASQSFTITAGAPGAPVIDLPQEGASVGNSVVLSGRTVPNARVRVTVRYQGKKLFVPSSGQLAALEVKADGKGQWVTTTIALKTPREVSGVTFLADVVAVGTGGLFSTPATVRFKR